MFNESDRIELKRIFTKELVKEVVAFSNTFGGKIYIGIGDDGEVVGLDDAKELMERISSIISDSVRPSVINYVNVTEDSVDDKSIICVEVQRGDGKPYYLAEKGMRPSGVYKRLGNTSVPVSEAAIREMIIENHGLTYESTRSLNQELTFTYATNHFSVRELSFDESQHRTLGLFDEDGLYNNLALLLSDQCPHLIKAAAFQDENKTIFRHRREFGGSLLKQLDDAYQYIEMQNDINTIYEGLRRIDKYDYDNSALREALVNAIVHRDYSLGGSIYINICNDYMEFVSLGRLSNGIELDDIMEGVSKSRNEKLAQVFYRLELIEAFGTGIRKMIGAYKDQYRQPEFKVTSNAFIVRLPKRQHEKKSDVIKEVAPTYDVSLQPSVNTLDDYAVWEDVLRRIDMNGFVTRKEVQEHYGFGQTKSGKLLRQLEEDGKIIKHGKGKNIYYKRS